MNEEITVTKDWRIQMKKKGFEMLVFPYCSYLKVFFMISKLPHIYEKQKYFCTSGTLV